MHPNAIYSLCIKGVLSSTCAHNNIHFYRLILPHILSTMATEEKQSVGVNGNTISCLQFTGDCAEALELYKVIYTLASFG